MRRAEPTPVTPPSHPPTLVPVQLKPTDGGSRPVRAQTGPATSGLQLAVEQHDLSVALGDALGDKVFRACGDERRRGNDGHTRRSPAHQRLRLACRRHQEGYRAGGASAARRGPDERYRTDPDVGSPEHTRSLMTPNAHLHTSGRVDSSSSEEEEGALTDMKASAVHTCTRTCIRHIRRRCEL